MKRELRGLPPLPPLPPSEGAMQTKSSKQEEALPAGYLEEIDHLVRQLPPPFLSLSTSDHLQPRPPRHNLLLPSMLTYFTKLGVPRHLRSCSQQATILLGDSPLHPWNLHGISGGKWKGTNLAGLRGGMSFPPHADCQQRWKTKCTREVRGGEGGGGEEGDGSGEGGMEGEG